LPASAAETQYCAKYKLAHTIRAQQLSVGLSQSALASRDWEHFLAKRESFITTLSQTLAIYNTYDLLERVRNTQEMAFN
jgi:hypothetical protein